MHYPSNDIQVQPTSTHAHIFIQSPDPYVAFLEEHGLNKNPVSVYWQVGTIDGTQGWILHLSVVKHQLSDLVQIVVPFLLDHGIAFKLPQNMDMARFINEGATGYENLGKMICVYPAEDRQAAAIATKLIQLTEAFRGPAIPTDRALGTIVYTRYGVFNPIIKKNDLGQSIKYLYDAKGVLIADPYHIPFRLPAGVLWPFASIAPPEVSSPEKLIRSTYYPIQTIKRDAKGNVLQALYFRRFWQIRHCIIKEGRKNMMADRHGRDIMDRLRWQCTLHKDLAGVVPLPNLIDFFCDTEKAFLIMERAKGVPLSEWIENRLSGHAWVDIAEQEKMPILATILRVIDAIDRLHSKGYIHRDITATNILVDNSGQITLIDLELAWSERTNTPNPAFKLGTPGFMSPEQARHDTPTIAQDVYSLGALVLNCLTGLFPIKIGQGFDLYHTLLLLTANSDLATLVEQCLAENPEDRPTISAMRSVVDACIDQLGREIRLAPASDSPPVKSLHLNWVIKTAILGMGQEDFLDENRCWLSTDDRSEKEIANYQFNLSVRTGWQEGLTGPLWLTAKLSVCGYSVKSIHDAFEQGWRYVNAQLTDPATESGPGLYNGTAGIALALTVGLRSGLLQPSEQQLYLLGQCFSTPSPFGGLRYGSAGQGIALLAARPWLADEAFEKLLTDCKQEIIVTQLSNGSWSLSSNAGDAAVTLGLSRGVAGIVWFLLAHYSFVKDAATKEAIRKAVQWLSSQKMPTEKSESKSKIEQRNGLPKGGVTPGIMLTYIRAYELLGEAKCKDIAVKWLETLPDRPVIRDYSFYSGLAGLGELYLEAYRVFGDAVWWERAMWIAQLFAHTIQKNGPVAGFWPTGDLINVTMDFFTGNSGIIHFLLRCEHPERISHPFWPS